MKYFVTTFCFLLFTFYSYAQSDSLIISVQSTEARLPYALIKLGNKIEQTTDKKGELHIQKSQIDPKDSLVVAYIGFYPKSLIINDKILQKDSLVISLKEKEYQLEEITVKAKNFNAENFFRKHLKSGLYPYSGKVVADIDLAYGTNLATKATTSFFQKGSKIETDSLKTPKEINLKRILSNTFSVAYWFCTKHYRKKFKCLYKGKERDTTVWEFKADKKQKNALLIEDVDDELTCLVKLNKQGIITEISVFLVDAKLKNATTTQFCKIKYTTFKKELIAKKVNLETFRKEGKKEAIDLLLYNFRKKDKK